jgi:hypothetical protein
MRATTSVEATALHVELAIPADVLRLAPCFAPRLVRIFGGQEMPTADRQAHCTLPDLYYFDLKQSLSAIVNIRSLPKSH